MKNCKRPHGLIFLLMKIGLLPLATVLFFLDIALAIPGNGQEAGNRKVSISVEKVQVKKILEMLADKADVKFVYSPQQVPSDKKASLKADGEELSTVLDKLLAPMQVNYRITDNQVVLSAKKNTELGEDKVPPGADLTRKTTTGELLYQAPPPQSITGKVLAADGNPIEGASVVVKGTSKGTVTNKEGVFIMTVDEVKGKLVASATGFEPNEIAIGKNINYTFSLTPTSNNLNEVVVIGYGTQKKVTTTGAVSTVKGDAIKAAPTSSITNTLVGRMPGLIAKNSSGEPGYDDSRLLIRGNNTLGDNSPLIVVDGVADRAGGFSRIDVNDIETVTILKDASAAIYGSRAANGVILVTTKRGKGGKTNISYSYDHGWKTPTILPEMTNAADYAVAINDITRLIDKNPVPTYSDAEIQKFRDGSDPVNYPNVNPMDIALKQFTQQRRHNITVSGGSDRVKFFTSLGYQFEDNIYKNSASNYKQYNLRSNIDIQANKDLRFYVNLSLRQEDRNSPWQGAPELWRNIVQGDPRQLIQYPNGLRRAVTSGGYNPLTAVDGTTGYQKDKRTYINADLGFNWDFSSIAQGLGMDGRLSVDKSNNFYKGFNKRWTLYTLNNSTGEYDPLQYGPTNALLNENMNQSLGITANIRLLYNRTFAKVHNISTFVAYEQYENRYDFLQGQRQNYVATIIDQIFAGDAKSATNNGSASESARQNYFGRLDYSYAEKYLVQFNWRYDGSENFPKGNRFGFFPGLSLGWRASEERFWKQHLSFINYFKIRGSYGKMGNDRIPRFNFLTQYTFDNNAVLGGANPLPYNGIRQVQTANPNITWEVATTYNLGFEAKLFKNEVSFELDIFKQQRDKILAQAGAVVPLYAGLALPRENVGSCESNGVELSLGYTKTVGSVRLNLGGNVTYAKSKILSFNEASGLPEWQKQTGKPIGADWLLYEATGIYRTQKDLDDNPQLGNSDLGDLIFKDVDGNGILDGNDRVRQGRTQTPEIIYGATLGVSYKQFDLSMLWQGAANVSSYVFYEGGGGGIGTYTQDYFNNRWTPENPNASGPRIYDREKTSVARLNTYFLQDAAYMRLKNLQLSYEVPKNVLSKLFISDCRLYVSGFNLITITKLKNIDPEANASSQNYAGWFNVQNKVYNVGVNVTF